MRVLWQPGVLALLLSTAVAAVRRLLTLQARVRALEQQTIRDPLTGAFNRRHMHEVLVTAVERHRRNGGPASLLLIDVDEFKSLNDAAGHAGGDRVLQAIAVLVQKRLRRIDALFRFGGDEFVVLLEGAWLADARGIAEQLRGAVDAARLDDRRPVSISVGVAGLQNGDSADDWLAAADAALYNAKRAGRNRVEARGNRAAPIRKRVG
jgi:diguanylate cyclase (GGDEF)-like protein